MCPRYITRISQRDEASGGEPFFFKRSGESFSRPFGDYFRRDGTLTVVDERVKVDKRRSAIAEGLFVPPASDQLHVTTRDNDDDDDDFASRVHVATTWPDARRPAARPRDTALYAARATASVDISRRNGTNDYPAHSCSLTMMHQNGS